MIEQNISKLIDIFVKEKLNEGIIYMPFVKSTKQLANLFTKGVSHRVFDLIVNKLGIIDIYSPT